MNRSTAFMAALAMCMLLPLAVVDAATYTWAPDAGGIWSTTDANGWNTGGGVDYPDGASDIVNLTGDITANRTITTVAGAKLGTLNLTDGGGDIFNWTIAGTESLTLDRGSSTTLINSTTGNNVISAPIIVAGTGALLQVSASAGTTLTLSGNISETAARTFRAAGGGIIVLSGTNSFSGGIGFTLTGTVVQVSSISDTGGSAVGVGTSNFTFNASNGTPALDYIGAANATTARGVTMESGAPGAGLRVNGAGTLTLTGNVNNTATAASQTRSLRLGGTNTGANTLSGTITDGSPTLTAIVKEDSGTWVLAPTSGSNLYTGSTTVSGGVLRANEGVGIPTGSLVSLSGGVWETNANIVRTVGGSAGQVRLTSGTTSGFSARGGAVIISFGGLDTPASVTWGSSFNAATLVLNDANADSTLEFRNPLTLGTAQRPIMVHANTVTMTGAVTQSGGGIDKGGAGTLVLSNAANTYSGATNINLGTFLMNGTHTGTSSSTGAGDYTVAAGATLGGGGSIRLAANKTLWLNNSGPTLAKLAPGNNGVGTLAISTVALAGTGGINLSGGDYRWEIGSLTDAGTAGTTGAGTNFDFLTLTGGTGSTTSLTLGGSATLTVVFTSVADPNSGNPFWDSDHTWKAIDVAGTATTAGTLTISNALWANNRGFVSYVGNGITGDSGDVYLNFTTVPEPAALSLIAIGALAVLRRRPQR